MIREWNGRSRGEDVGDEIKNDEELLVEEIAGDWIGMTDGFEQSTRSSVGDGSVTNSQCE
jgi:hypothetical protein